MPRCVCLARHGTVKTTVDDIARQAGVSRATVYRAFPGGRDEVLRAVVDTEVARLFSRARGRAGRGRDLTAALVAGIVEASTRIREHPALAYLVEHEPGTVLGHLAFDESDRLLATASRFDRAVPRPMDEPATRPSGSPSGRRGSCSPTRSRRRTAPT